MADGKVIIDTALNASGIKDGLSKLGSTIKSGLGVATKAISAVSAGLSAAAGASIKVGSDFESSMSQVAATMGMTAEEVSNGSEQFEILRNAAKDAGATTQFSATQAGEALNYLALAGYDAATAADTLPAVLNLASAGGLDLAYASDLATDAMSALGIEASKDNLTRFGDEMAKTASKANTSVGQLGEAILTVGGTAKGLAGGTNELNTALGVLANRGIKGAEGGTALRNIILALSAPTDQAAKKMEELGLKVYDAEGNMRPLNEIFKDLNGILGDMTQGEQTQVLNEIFNKVDLKSAQAMLAGCGDEFDNLSAAIADSSGAMQDMADTQLNNLKGDITILKSALEGLGIEIYESMSEPLRDAASKATEYVGRLTDAFKGGGLDELIKEAGDIFAELVTKAAEQAPKMADTAVNLIKAFVDGIAKNKDRLFKAAGQIAKTLADGLVKLLPKSMQQPVKDAVEAITKSFESGGLRKAIETVGRIIQELGKVITNVAKVILPPLTTAIDFLGEHLDILAPIISGIIITLTGLKIASAVAGAFSALRAATDAATVSAGLMTVATDALNLSMLANPAGILIAAFGAIAGGVLAYNLTQDEGAQKTDLFNQKLAEQAQAIRDTQAARDENISGIKAESGYTQSLWEELQNITDENGKIKEGYEERAAFITGALSDALGIEIETVDGVIQKYDELKGSVDQLIEKKKAEALLSAYETDYANAIKNRTEANNNLIDATNRLTAAQAVKENTDQQIVDIENKIKEAQDNTSLSLEEKSRLIEEQSHLLFDLQENQANANSELGAAQTAYNDAKTVAEEYNTTVSNYEYAAGVLQSGSGKVSEAIARMTYGFKDSTIATQAELQQQVQNAQENYEKLRGAVNQGGSGVTQQAVEEAKLMLALSQLEYAKMPGVTVPEIEKWEEIVNAAIQESNTPETAEEKSQETVEATVDPLVEGKPEVEEAAAGLSKAENSGVESVDTTTPAKESAQAAVDAKTETLENGTPEVEISSAQNTEGINTGASSVDTETTSAGKAQEAVNSASETLDAGQETVTQSSENLMNASNSAISGADLQSGSASVANQAVDTLVETLEAGTERVKKAATELGRAFSDGIKAANTGQKIKNQIQTAIQLMLTAIDNKNKSANSAGKKLGENIVTGFQSSAVQTKLVLMTNTAMTSVLAAITGKNSAAMSAGRGIAEAFVAGVKAGKMEDATNHARAMVDSFINTIRAGTGGAKGAGNTLGSAAASGLSGVGLEEKGRSAGRYFAIGFADGITANTYRAEAKARAMAEAANRAAKKALGINSPSKEGHWLGEMFVSGTAGGIEDNAGLAEQASEDMAQAIIDSMDISAAVEKMRMTVMVESQKLATSLITKVISTPQNADAAGDVYQTVNINQPVKSYIETERALRRVGKELAFG